MKFPVFKLVLAAGLLVVSAAQYALAATTAQLELNTIDADQTVRLVIQSNQPQSNQVQPDFSVLQDNFRVLGTNTSQNITLGSGGQTVSTTWVTELEPLSTGTFTLPAIPVGAEQTAPLQLTVLPVPPGAGRDVYLELETEQPWYYVQQQINLVVRLYVGVNLTEGTLSEPEVPDTEVRRMGTDEQYPAQRDGRGYQVVERRYALFPTSSGELVIPPIRFQGTQRGNNNANNNQLFNGLLNSGPRLRAASDPFTLEIRPPDPDFSGQQWLPAKSLKISEPRPLPEEIILGQPFTRRISITAEGLTAEQLPEITFQENEAFRQYPDRPTRNTRDDGTLVTGEVFRDVAIIAGQEGVFTMPAVELVWWDTVNDVQATAVLPGRQIRAVADPVAVATGAAPASSLGAVDIGTDPGASSSRLSSWSQYSWPAVSFALLLLWLGTLVYYRRRPPAGQPAPAPRPATDDGAAHFERLLLACRDNDPQGARQHFARWWLALGYGKLSSGTIQSDVERGFEPVAEEIQSLDRRLYARTNGEELRPWSGRNLESALRRYRQSLGGGAAKESGLPDLYPGG